jgi:hypothetical protein
LIYEGKTLAVMKVRGEFLWDESRNFEMDSKSIAKYKYPIDLAALRSRIKEKNSRKVGKEKSWQ